MKKQKQPTVQPLKHYVKVDSKTTILVDRSIGDEEAKKMYMEKLHRSEQFVKNVGGLTAKKRKANKQSEEDSDEFDQAEEIIEVAEISEIEESEEEN